MSNLLQPLLETIATVRERTKAASGWNEAQTRASLIDPILTALGWDTSDPGLVRHEFTSHGGRADYALLGDGEDLAAIVEAKALGHPLDTKEIGQTTNYANILGAPYAVLTNGDRWVFYDVFKQAKIEDRLVVEVSVANSEAQQTALALLALWRPNASAKEWRRAERPFLDTTPTDSPVPPPPPPKSGWVPLPEFQAEPFAKPYGPARLPNGAELPLKDWKDLLVGTARWLAQQDAQLQQRLPVPAGPKSKRYLVNTEPRHASGTKMSEPSKITARIWLETHYSQQDILRHTVRIIEHCQLDPTTILLRAKP